MGDLLGLYGGSMRYLSPSRPNGRAEWQEDAAPPQGALHVIQCGPRGQSQKDRLAAWGVEGDTGDVRPGLGERGPRGPSEAPRVPHNHGDGGDRNESLGCGTRALKVARAEEAGEGLASHRRQVQD